jgi:hypothetical protein
MKFCIQRRLAVASYLEGPGHAPTEICVASWMEIRADNLSFDRCPLAGKTKIAWKNLMSY